MFYVKTETDKHEITTSYTTEKQARQYGGEPYGAELYLMGEDPEDGFEVDEYTTDLQQVGRVRTIFRSKQEPSRGKFSLYIRDEKGRWYYSGLSFASYSDANQTVKGPLSKIFDEMLVLEDADHEVLLG